jgi:hypothetical protein
VPAACCEKHSTRKLLILLDFQIAVFSARATQLLDFSGLGGRSREAVNKVIHKKLPFSQSPVESMTYPGFRAVALKKMPKSP